MDPVIRKTWVDLKLMQGPKMVAEGSTAVNSPLHWEGLNFYQTATNTDQLGKPFVGLQITRDPGIIYVYIGFFILSMGVAYYLLRRMCGLR
jgi:cytochrome c biogenesis protein ResB